MGESRKVLNLVIQSVTVGAVEMFGGGAAAWRTIAFIYCIIGIITNTLAVFSVKELSDEELKDDSVAGEEDDKLSFKQTIKLLFSPNHPAKAPSSLRGGGSISNLHKTGTKHPERDPNEKITSYSACPCTRSDPFHGLQQGRRGHSPPAGPRNGGPDHYVLSDRNQPGVLLQEKCR